MKAPPTAPRNPPATLVFAFSPVRWPEVVRVIELRPNQTSQHLAKSVAEAFEVERPSEWRMFLTGRAWERSGERIGGGALSKAPLSSLGIEPGARPLLMVVDGGERWFRGELLRTGECDSTAKYPRVIEKVGEAPDPFEMDDFFGMLGTGPSHPSDAIPDEDARVANDDDLAPTDDDDDGGDDDVADRAEVEADDPLDRPAPDDAEARALAEAARLALVRFDKHFERADAAVAPRAVAEVDEDTAIARRLCVRFGEDAEAFARWSEASGVDVEEWLGMLPFDLEDHDRVDAAAALAVDLAKLLDPAELLMDRAVILGRAGRHAEAREQAEAVVDRYPEVYDVRVRASAVLVDAGDRSRAEELALSVFERDLEGDDVELYSTAIETLESVYRATGRTAEAEALLTSRQARLVEEFEANGGVPTEWNPMQDLFGGMDDAGGAVVTPLRREPPVDRRRDRT